MTDRTTQPDDTSGLPLDGIRVLDLGMFWAGPFAGKWLADGGAQVIKIESGSHPDNLRILARGVYPNGEPGERSWNRSGMINERNRNKLGITIEMGTTEGREIFRRLVAISDVVIENFSNRVMKKWELDYDHLSKINPEIILASVYSQGSTGPESGYVSFGGTLEQLAGITYITGYANEMPGVLTVQLPDPAGGAMATGLILSALRQRRLTGKGLHIDLSQRENVVGLLGAQVLDFGMNERITERIGNRDPHMAPHGCYRCSGEDAWVTLAISSDDEWAALAHLIGQESLIHDDRFATVGARHRNHDELDSIISDWTKDRGKIDTMHQLQDAGIAAGAVYTAADLYADPHLEARSFWEATDEPDAGPHRFPGRPGQLSKTPLGTRLPTPTLGQHNEYVFRELLGMTDDEYAALETSGLITTEPTEAAQKGRL